MTSHPSTPVNLRSPVETRPRTAANVTADGPLRDDVLQREQERFGGFKFGAAFFGWLTATGTAVLLTALVGAIGTGIGLGSGATVDDARTPPPTTPEPSESSVRSRWRPCC